VRLSVEDDGVGMGGENPKGTGLGGQILAAMAADLGSKIHFDSSAQGTRVHLVFKAAGVRKSSSAL